MFAHKRLKVVSIRSDRGGEYVNKNLKDYFSQKGISHQFSVPGSSQQNGVAERFNRTLRDKAKCMLEHSNLPADFWDEAIMTAAYVTNMVIRKDDTVSPIEKWTSRQPRYSHLRTFGCKAYFVLPTEQRDTELGKLAPNAKIGIFVGYAPNQKAYKIFRDGAIVTAYNVRFDEDTFPGCNLEYRSQKDRRPVNIVSGGGGAAPPAASSAASASPESSQPGEDTIMVDEALPERANSVSSQPEPIDISDSDDNVSMVDEAQSEAIVISSDSEMDVDSDMDVDVDPLVPEQPNVAPSPTEVQPHPVEDSQSARTSTELQLVPYVSDLVPTSTEVQLHQAEDPQPTNSSTEIARRITDIVPVSTAVQLHEAEESQPTSTSTEIARRITDMVPVSTAVQLREAEDSESAVTDIVPSSTAVQRHHRGFARRFHPYVPGSRHIAMTAKHDEPLSYESAMSMPDAREWEAAATVEMKALHDNETWELVDLPKGKRVIGSKWVLKKKFNADGTLERYKARLVATGYSQREGIDYSETFSPVIRPESVRLQWLPVSAQTSTRWM